MKNGTAVVHVKDVWLSGGDREDTNAPMVPQLWRGISGGAIASREKKNSALGRRSCEPSPGHSQKLVRSWTQDKPLHPDKSTDQSVDAMELVSI